MRNRDGRIGDERRQRVPLLAPRQADLAGILADTLVADVREEDTRRVQKATVESPRGTDRGTRNLMEDKGQASERGRTL